MRMTGLATILPQQSDTRKKRTPPCYYCLGISEVTVNDKHLFRWVVVLAWQSDDEDFGIGEPVTIFAQPFCIFSQLKNGILHSSSSSEFRGFVTTNEEAVMVVIIHLYLLSR